VCFKETTFTLLTLQFLCEHTAFYGFHSAAWAYSSTATSISKIPMLFLLGFEQIADGWLKPNEMQIFHLRKETTHPNQSTFIKILYLFLFLILYKAKNSKPQPVC